MNESVEYDRGSVFDRQLDRRARQAKRARQSDPDHTRSVLPLRAGPSTGTWQSAALTGHAKSGVKRPGITPGLFFSLYADS